MQRRGNPTGIMGGDRSSFDSRRPQIRRHIAPLPRVHFGSRFMCRCGGCARSLWRGRWYCRVCGRWVADWVFDLRMEEIGGPDPRTETIPERHAERAMSLEAQPES